MAAEGRFSCDNCGQSYAWKPSLSGKKARCACGAVIAVPSSPTLIAGVAKHKASRPVPASTAAVAIPVQAAAAVPIAELGYVSARRRLHDEVDVNKLVWPIRDTYVPVALLVVGFIAMVLWALLAVEAGPRVGMLVLFGSGISTAIKTGVLVGLAILIAPHAGLSLGTFWSALLKLAAIVIFSDAILMWLEEFMAYMGALPSSGYRRGWGRVRLIELVLATAVIGILMRYLFDMDREEVGYVAMPIAFASWIVGLILKLVLVAVLEAATAPPQTPPNVAATGPPATAPTGASPQPSTGPPPAPARQDVSPRDRTISARIAERSPFVKTAMQWNERRPLRSRGQKQLFDRLYEAGADRMFVDMQGSGGLGGTLYIELPLNPAGRAACIDAYKNYCSDVRMEVDPREATDDGRRYLVIELKRM